MVWHDLLFDRLIEGPSLGQALATAFQVEPNRVLVVDEFTPTLDVEGVALLAERTRRRGDFPLQLSVYVRDESVWQRVHPFGETVRLVKQLSRLLGSSCLLSGDADEPDSDILVRPSGETLLVTLDEDRLDRDEFVIRTAHPFQPASAPV